MDALTHMLTEPLDPKEENVGHITEECTLGNCRVNLPEDLLEDVSSIIHSPVLDVTLCYGSFTYMHNLQYRCYIIMIPFGLPQPDIFFSVMSESTWSEVLSDSQRRHLRQFLPQFPENNVGEQEKTISDLFNNRNFNFGNPLHLAQKLFRGASQHLPSQ